MMPYADIIKVGDIQGYYEARSLKLSIKPVMCSGIPYMYTAQRGLGKKMKFISGCLQARTPAEAYNNARLLVKERGGLVTHLLIKSL